MNIIPDETFHIYNQGNNQETVFYEDGDYRAFLKLFRKFVYPHAKVLAWCLMPNHFHFLIHATKDSSKLKQIGNIEVGELSNGFRLLESQYAHYINNKHARSGSLFRQKTKAKPMSEGDIHYEFTAFHYIHQNPFIAGLAAKMEDWKYSSYADYMGLRKGTLCDQELAFRLIGFNKENFVKESCEVLDDKLLKKIFY